MKFRIESSFESKEKDQNIKKTYNWELENQLFEIVLDTIENKISITFKYECEHVTSQKILNHSKALIALGGWSMNAKPGEDVDEDIWKTFREYLMDKEYQTEYLYIYAKLNEVLHDFLYLMNFHLDRIYWRAPKSKLSTALYFDENENSWIVVALSPFLESTIGVFPKKYLNQTTANTVDRILEQGYTPLVALRYLSIGANSNDHKIKWITATTALEIAIKEIFIRIDPKLEELLTEIPSPPLYKIYKGILKSITGYESPYYKEIQKGVEIRNRIIHRPINMYIEAQDSFNYIYMANCAIEHLLLVVKSIKSGTNLTYKKKHRNKVDYNRYLNS